MSAPTDAATSAPPPANPRPRRLSARLGRVAGIGLLIYLGYFAVWEVPREFMRWKAASAEVLALNGELDDAIALLDEALKWDPGNASCLLRRAKWNALRGDYEAAATDSDAIVKRMLHVHEQGEHESLRFTLLIRVKRHEDIIKELEEYEAELPAISSIKDKNSRLRRERIQAFILNEKAYARGVAGVELDQALLDVNRAIRLWRPDAMLLDTRGFIQYQRGELKSAERDLNRAVDVYEVEYFRTRGNREERPTLTPDVQRGLAREERSRRSVAVLYYHRGLVHEALRKHELAAADFAKVRELGEEPVPDLF